MTAEIMSVMALLPRRGSKVRGLEPWRPYAVLPALLRRAQTEFPGEIVNLTPRPLMIAVAQIYGAHDAHK